MSDTTGWERELLSAMRTLDTPNGKKCVAVLRFALKSLNLYDADKSEIALSDTGEEDPNVQLLYSKLRELVQCGLADGRGDLKTPAGPCYTECRINSVGLLRLEELLRIHDAPTDLR